MVGFAATALTTKEAMDDDVTEADLPIITVDPSELEAAKWFHRSFVKERLAGDRSQRIKPTTALF